MDSRVEPCDQKACRLWWSGASDLPYACTAGDQLHANHHPSGAPIHADVPPTRPAIAAIAGADSTVANGITTQTISLSVLKPTAGG